MKHSKFIDSLKKNTTPKTTTNMTCPQRESGSMNGVDTISNNPQETTF